MRLASDPEGPKAPEPAPTSPETFDLEIQVLTQTGDLVTTGDVALHPPHSPSTSHVVLPIPNGPRTFNRTTRDPLTSRLGAGGTVTFEGLSAGVYNVAISRSTLSESLCFPPREGGRATYGGPAITKYVRVSPESPSRVTLYVPDPCVVEGYVLGPEGAPLEGVQVGLHGARHSMVSDSCVTDSTGHYIVDLFQGAYETRLSFTDEFPRPAGLAYPEPTQIEVSAGGHHYLELQLSAGSHSVTGRIVDQDGQPFSGLTLNCTYAEDAPETEPTEPAPLDRRLIQVQHSEWRMGHHTERTPSQFAASARTTDDGSFVLEGLPPARYELRVGDRSDYDPKREVGENTLAQPPEVVSVDLRNSSLVDIGTQIAGRSHPCWFEGTLSVDKEWVKETGIPMRNLVLNVQRAGGKEYEEVPFEEDGSFLWACETPADVVTFRFGIWRRNEVSTTIEPLPDGRIPVSLSFP